MQVIVDGDNSTYFPSNGEQPPVPPNEVMKSEWYMRNVNYWEVFDEEDPGLYKADLEYPYFLLNDTKVDIAIKKFKENKSPK